MSWVASVIRQESTKKVDDTRIARSAVGTSVTPRAATIGRKMHITVLVPNRKASSTRGASVSSTSHSGITTLSSTWLVQNTPPKKVREHPARVAQRSRPGDPHLALLRGAVVVRGAAAAG